MDFQLAPDTRAAVLRRAKHSHSYKKTDRSLRKQVSDTRVLALIASFLEQGVIDDLGTHVPEQGSPQGAVISPLLSNIYLDGLDHLMVEHGFEMVRYADDLVVLTRSHEQAEAALWLVAKWVADAELLLHPQKTVIVTHEKGFDFLGYHFEAGRRWPRSKSMKKLQDTIRTKTRRTNGHSLGCIIMDVNVILRGWYAYYKHSHDTTFHIVDGWIRMRLRSILRRRDGRTGPGRGYDHKRWPNAYFANHGLFILRAAYDIDRQSSLR